MLNSAPISPDDQARIEEIVARGPGGALALAAISTALVFALWFTFYALVFLPRATP